MYQSYVAIGSVFVLTGLLIAIYLFYTIKVNYGNQINLLATINAVATIITGIIYIYSSTLVEETNFNTTLIHVSPDTILNTTNNQITPDLFELNGDYNQNDEEIITTTIPATEVDFLKNYQQLVDNILKRKHHRNGRILENVAKDKCLQNIFLQHAMMVYAFVQNVLLLINECHQCKEKANGCYTFAYLICLLILPVACTVALYYAVFAFNVESELEVNSLTNASWLSDTIEQQMNINNTAVNKVVEKIYKIVNNTNTTSVPHNVNVYNKQTYESCNYTTIPFKIYIFLLVILGYITTAYYLKTNEIQQQTSGNNNVKKWTYLFVATWLPGITELFTRIFLTEKMPSIISDLFAILGSINILLININDAFIISKQNKNMIRPIGDA